VKRGVEVTALIADASPENARSRLPAFFARQAVADNEMLSLLERQASRGVRSESSVHWRRRGQETGKGFQRRLEAAAPLLLSLDRAMPFSSGTVPPDYLGARGEGERRKRERRTRPRPGGDRRTGERRRAALRSAVLAAATVVFPIRVKPASLDAMWPRPPVPTVTTTIESVVGVPAEHAYDQLIREASARYGVDTTLIRSVIQTESAFDALTVSRAGAVGLMQLMPEVAVELGVTDPLDPRQNVMGGVKYLRELLDQYRGNVRLALASYNAGAANVTEYGGVPPFPETQKYVKQVTTLVASSRRTHTD
jgi:soluble lytic murein transglycosylase-like protein